MNFCATILIAILLVICSPVILLTAFGVLCIAVAIVAAVLAIPVLISAWVCVKFEERKTRRSIRAALKKAGCPNGGLP